MSHGSNHGSTSVAWFKLAELITRREREKALSVYRLLSHSFACKAYALQLEADILWSLDDKAAPEKYRQAAFLYHKEKLWIDAAGICENLYALNNNDVEVLVYLVRYYALLQWPDRFLIRIKNLCVLIEKKIAYNHHLISAIKQILEDVSPKEEPSYRAWIKEQITLEDSFFSPELKHQIYSFLN